MSETHDTPQTDLSHLPADELLAYGRSLGLRLDDDMAPGELLRRIRERREMLLDLKREPMLEICVWARRPVRESAGKEQLAREISTIEFTGLDGLSRDALAALARLRDVDVKPEDDEASLARRIIQAEPLWARVRRAVRKKRRAWVGSMLTKVLWGPGEAPPNKGEPSEYKFLPEEPGAARLRSQIQEAGVVGGLARTIKGVADDYVREKLDEIERRIDRKLDEIDRRLGEWRDREIHNRLRIIKITLVASMIVALISLGYDALRSRVRSSSNESPAATSPAPDRTTPPP